MDFVHQCRMERLELLKKNSLSSKEIAAELGFQDVHSFYQWNRQFRRKTGDIHRKPETPGKNPRQKNARESR